jgi:beta-glucosidase/6-phospho-beta-glucosidase/beta-galactosidase
VASDQFMFATGIENSYPTVMDARGTKRRVDEMAETHHYDRWREDFGLARELGVTHLRYGPPYYRAHAGPGQYDWSFADETLNALHDLGLEVIADLCHFGVPDWVGDFQNPDWPEHFAEYARAFADRYAWIRHFTPVNEIAIAARFSALYGWWNEQCSDARSYARALKHLCRANVLAMRAILAVRHDATFIQSESSEYFHAEEPSCIALARTLNQRRFLSLDLTYGYPLRVEMYEYLLDNGWTREDYGWFRENHVRARCVMGNDYYVTNEHLVHSDGSTTASGEIFGYYVITHQYYSRYRLPVMHTETNIAEPAAVAWLRKEWANLHRLKEDGVPILGFTWYSLTDQVDWDSALRERAGNVNALGLYDLDRHIRPVGTAYKQLIAQWRDILPTESFELHVR